MDTLQRYRKRADRPVVAIRLALDTEGFSYRKWGGVQRCKPGDWLLDNAGDVYTVDAEVFARTYRALGNGLYAKSTPVWVRVATAPGSIRTKEGTTHYAAGDLIVFNQPDATDGYAIAAADFASMYEADDAQT